MSNRRSAGSWKRDMRRVIALLLMLTMAAACLPVLPETVSGEPAQGVLFQNFEDFAQGPLNGQFGWTNASPEVTVTDEIDAVSGSNTVKILDDDKGRAMGARLRFSDVKRGSVEWWVMAAESNRLVMLLETVTPDGTKPVEWIGFLANGTFEYYDGGSRLNTSETYETGKWYRFHIAFDAENHRKTIYVFDSGGGLVWTRDTEFRDTSVQSVNQFRLATISTTTGTFYLDDLRVLNAEIADRGSLESLAFFPDSFNLQAGDSRNVNLLAGYSSGMIRSVAEEAAYSVSNPNAAEVRGGAVVGLSPGSAVIEASLEGKTAVLRVNVFSENEIPPYYNIEPRPLERTTSLEGLRIVIPGHPEWAAVGERIARELQAKWNLPAELAVSNSEQFRQGWSGNTVVIGNLGNNEQMARLYGMRMSYADAVYPGAGGYELRTVIDPFGLGGNTIVLGASDVAGAELGADRLVQLMQEASEPAIPWLNEAKLAQETASYLQYDGNPSESDIERALSNADVWLGRLKPTVGVETDADNLHYVFSRIKIFGENYQLSGIAGFGEVYKKLLKGFADFVNRYPDEARAQLNNGRNMWTDGEEVIQNWTVLEASPIFTDPERAQIVSALYGTYAANALDNYLKVARDSAPRWNHEIFPALSIVAGGDYFLRYYGLAEAASWKHLGERIFTGNTSTISLDEGSDYLMHVPMVNIDYAMATGQLEFMTRSLRPSADLNVLMIDNLGTMAGGGDTYPFGYSGPYSWGHSQVMYAASWLYRDPVYRVLLERAKNGPFPDQRMTDLDYPIHRYIVEDLPGEDELNPLNYPTVRAYPVEQGVYEDLAGQEQAPLDVEQADTFHKLTFREGFGLDDSYLIMDGFSAGRHGHQDGNAILNYTANGRLFLTDRDYIENTPEHHSGLVVVKDGEQGKKPPLAKLEWAADIEGTALARSVVPNYNGTDWTRSIISPDGSFYIIYDDVDVKESGSYMLKNLWQTLGTPSIRGERFEAEQQGVKMTIDSMDNSELRTHDRYGHFIKYWKTQYNYPYADRETVLSQVRGEQHYEAGERAEFINVLSSVKNGENGIKTKRINESTLEISRTSEKWLAVYAAVNSNPFASDGKFHLIGEGQLLAAEATWVRIGDHTEQFSEPVIFRMNTATGDWAAYPLRRDHVRYDESGNPIREGEIRSGTAGWSRQMLNELERSVTAPGDSDLWKKQHTPLPQAERDWRKIHKFPGEVASSAWGDLNNDGREDLVLGGKDGTVQAIDAMGNVLWSFPAIGRVNEVTVQQLGDEPTVFIATEAFYVYALDVRGGEKWSYKLPDSSTHREVKGNLIGATNVRVAHVNGMDQDPWVMVGTQFRYIYGFDRNGNLLYSDLLYYYGIEDAAFADFDGDGKEEGAYALEYFYYFFWDETKLTRSSSAGGPGYKKAVALEGWNGGTKPAILFGTKQSEVRLIEHAGSLQERWVRNVGGEVNDIKHGDFNGDGSNEILVGTDGFQLYALNEDGSVRFRASLGDRVLQVSGIRSDWDERPGAYMAAADNGKLFILDEQGDIVKEWGFDRKMAGIFAGGENGALWTVLENGDVFLYKE